MPNSSQFSCSDTFESKIDFFLNMSVIWQGSPPKVEVFVVGRLSTAMKQNNKERKVTA